MDFEVGDRGRNESDRKVYGIGKERKREGWREGEREGMWELEALSGKR